ncbi:hypothetical protein GQ55_9G581400 [Panicum hallii var. hallii]|uniref:Uncharacterized protein n=1 Tax=Panicum hallii var. hallii TaxID=1504633 RepID=A0A2T7CGH3_9POAL|nr:hypothetical protein GQ55_9G581400 [Panicum hallii var. hallii]
MQGFKKTWIGEIVYSYLPEIPLPMFLLLGRSARTWHASCALNYHKTLPVPICSENLNLVRHVCAICSLKIRTNIGGFITAHGYAGLQVLRQRVASCAHLCTGCLWLGRSLRSSGAAATSTHGVTARVSRGARGARAGCSEELSWKLVSRHEATGAAEIAAVCRARGRPRITELPTASGG